MMSRLLIALLGTFAFGAVGVADDLACIRSRSALGMRRAPRLRWKRLRRLWYWDCLP